jgi:ribosome-binding protein aMBF1 (putative translation factor)
MEKSIYSKKYRLLLRRLREARKRSGLTQVMLAKQLGQSQSFVSKCERGERRIDLMEAREFCRALNVSFIKFVRELDQELRGRL